MAKVKPVPPKPEDVETVAPSPPIGDAFDLWLQRGLHELFDDVANEPVPEELLRIIEAGRQK